MAVNLTAWGVLMYTLFMPIAGWLGDRFSAVAVVKYGFYGLMILGALNAYYVQQGGLPILLILLVGIMLACIQGPAMVMLYDKFEIQERYRSIGLGHALGSMVLSGSTPLISLWIWKVSNSPVAPLWYSLILCCFGLVAVFRLQQPLLPFRNDINKNMTLEGLNRSI